jgi:L-fuculose-phosphate aldolase
VVLFTICNKELLPIIGAYDPSALRVLLDGVPTYPRSVTVSNDRLGEEFAAVMGGKRACMMRAHGITTAGRTIEEATVTAIKLNDLAEMNYRAYLLGNPQPIPAEDLEAFRTMTSESLGASNWPYYCRLVGEE